jgi:hypothetical protein
MKDWASYKQNWYTAVIQVESDEKFREIVKWVENNVEGHRKHTIWSVTEYRKLTIKFRHQKDYAWFVLRWA